MDIDIEKNQMYFLNKKEILSLLLLLLLLLYIQYYFLYI